MPGCQKPGRASTTLAQSPPPCVHSMHSMQYTSAYNARKHFVATQCALFNLVGGVGCVEQNVGAQFAAGSGNEVAEVLVGPVRAPRACDAVVGVDAIGQKLLKAHEAT